MYVFFYLYFITSICLVYFIENNRNPVWVLRITYYPVVEIYKFSIPYKLNFEFT